MDISAVEGSGELASTTEGLLAQLPSWFGLPEANTEYVKSAHELSGLVARAGDEPVGVLLHRRHFPEAAEVHLMAVSPGWHRRGVGTAMVDRLVSALRRTDCQLLHVKTLGPSRPHPGYAATREFYRSAGFVPLEETTELWGSNNPCLVMVRPLHAG